VLDNEQIGLAKHCMRPSALNDKDGEEMVGMVRKVMATGHKLFTRHTRKPVRAGEVSQPYKFESKTRDDLVIENSLTYLSELESLPRKHLSKTVVNEIFSQVPGLLPGLKQYTEI
jgi:hypothetical protein